MTGVGASVVDASGPVATTIDLGDAELPLESGGVTIDVKSDTVRAAALALDGAPAGSRLVLTTAAGAGFVARAPTVALILVGFFALASAFIFFVLRMLQGQIASMLAAAKRIGGGDFSGEVPVEGNDELAGLAREFNLMSERLSDQMRQLQRQREEPDQSVRRIGEAFAAGLDRSALLEIVIETALAAAQADAGEVLLAGHDVPEASAGERRDRYERILGEAARASIADGAPVERGEGELHAIAHPLIRAGEQRIDGAMAIARSGKPFDANEKEVLRYLIGQASVSVENIGLHEQVAEQAVTDELTGLSNNRHFRGWMGSRRSGSGASAVSSRWSCSTSTTSSRSTTRSGTCRATRSCARSGRCCGSSRAASTRRPATAARSSCWRCPRRPRPAPPRSPSAFASGSRRRRSMEWRATPRCTSLQASAWRRCRPTAAIRAP